jgi:adenylate cyclase
MKTLAVIGNLEAHFVHLTEQTLTDSVIETCDLALIQDVLPDMHAIDVLSLLRGKNPNMAGILLSTNIDVATAINAVNAGFSGIVEQPLDGQVLEKAIDEALRQLSVREENTRLHTLMPLYRLGERFLKAATIQQVLDELVDAVCQEIHVPCVSVMMPAADGGELKIVAYRGIGKQFVDRTTLKPGEKIAGWVFENGEPVILNRGTQHKTPFSSHLKRQEVAASISFPLKGRDTTVGVLNVSQTKPDIEYSQSDLELLAIICSQAVIAIENLTYIREREEHARVKALLEQYVSPEVAGLLLRSNQDLMDVGDIMDLTVLFADIRHFTLLVQHLSLEELRIFLNCFFDFFTREVFANKGTLDKFMGDAALVFFGAPLVIERPSVAAVETAVRIISAFELLKKEWSKKSHFFKQVGLGIGISRGRMFLGNVGSTRRLDYTVIGTEVNIAQRLASDTESGQILITEKVYSDITGVFPVKKEKSRILRGMEKEVSLYSILPSTSS